MSLEQSRYRAGWLAPGREATWKIPVCAHFGNAKSSHEECFLLEEARVERVFEAASCPAFLHPNADETGYYRWALSPDRLSELAATHLQKLTPAERLALPSHALALLEADRIDGARYVDLLTSLSRDRHWLTVEAIAAGVVSLARWMRVEDSNVALSRWARRLLGPHAERVGLEPKQGEPPSNDLLREPLFEALVAAGAGAKAVEQSKAAARRFIEDPNDPVGALALKLSVAAQYGDEPLHQGLVRALTVTRSPTAREYAVRALGKFRDAALLRRSYQLLLDGTLKAQDFWAVTRGARDSDEAQAVLWSWFLEAEKDLGKLLGERVGAQLPWVLAGFCNESELAQARKHFDPIEPFGPGALHNFGQALETATRCVELRKRHSSSIATRLNQLSRR
jgi:alanyl aminopeptidase